MRAVNNPPRLQRENNRGRAHLLVAFGLTTPAATADDRPLAAGQPYDRLQALAYG